MRIDTKNMRSLILLTAVILIAGGARTGHALYVRGRSRVACPNTDSCAECARYENCGWCHFEGEDTRRCMTGSRSGPSLAAADKSFSGCSAWQYTQCEDESFLDFWNHQTRDERNVTGSLDNRLEVYSADYAFAAKNVDEMQSHGGDLKTQLNRNKRLLDNCNGVKMTRENEEIQATTNHKDLSKKVDNLETAVAETEEQLDMEEAKTDQTAAVVDTAKKLRAEVKTLKKTLAQTRAQLSGARQDAIKAKMKLDEQVKICDDLELTQQRILHKIQLLTVNLQIRKAVRKARSSDVKVLNTMAEFGLTDDGAFGLEDVHDPFPLGTTRSDVDSEAFKSASPEMPSSDDLPKTGGNILLGN